MNTSLLTGHNTLRRHLLGLLDSPLCRKCGVREETSAHILCECEALASLRHMYLGSFFLQPEDIRNIGLGAIWNLSKAMGLPWFDMGHKGPAIRPRCIGGWEAPNPNVNQSIYLSMNTKWNPLHDIYVFVWITCFGRHCGPAIRQTAERITLWGVMQHLRGTTSRFMHHIVVTECRIL